MIKSTIYSLGIILIISCANSSNPNYQFFPDMYEPIGYEPYQEASIFPNGQEALHPVQGTIKRGWMPYGYSDTEEGYLSAKETLVSPLEMSKSNLDKGKELYDIYCAICHGNKGDGQGTLVKREKFLGVPSYADREITQGSIYHVIYYGRNSMGPHASQLGEKERWQVVMYVEELKNDLKK